MPRKEEKEESGEEEEDERWRWEKLIRNIKVNH